MDINQLLEQSDVFQYKVIEVTEIPFSPAVREACKENRCGRYGTCWTCPPGVGEIEVLEQKIKRFSSAAVFTCKYELEDSFDFEGMQEGAGETQGILRELADELRAQKTEVMVLGCEGGHICTKCNYPATACRFPERAIPSVEACGIDVVTLAKKTGLNYNNGPDTVTYFCMILY
jgi:predicted metal-binding protein